MYLMTSSCFCTENTTIISLEITCGPDPKWWTHNITLRNMERGQNKIRHSRGGCVGVLRSFDTL